MASEPEDIPFILQEYVDESGALVKQITEICWYMRGGITREEAWMLSPKERKACLKLIEENVSRTNETGLALV